MRKPTFIGGSLFVLAILSSLNLVAGVTHADTTITLDQPVHFTTAEGSDLVLEVGDYKVEVAEEWLRVTPSEGQAIDALLLEAQVANHKESLPVPLALSTPGASPDTHHLALLLPGGKRMEAIGSYSGIRSRAGSRRLTIAQIRTLAEAQRASAPAIRTEWSTLLFGGGGGNRNFNLDCGSGGVMIGAAGRWGSWLDELKVICRRLHPFVFSLGSEFTRGPTATGGGRSRPAVRCPSGQVVAGMKAIRYGSFVHNMTFICKRWIPRDQRALGTGKERTLGPVAQALGTKTSQAYPCPRDKVGKALRGKSGAYIDSLRFICDQWNK